MFPTFHQRTWRREEVNSWNFVDPHYCTFISCFYQKIPLLCRKKKVVGYWGSTFYLHLQVTQTKFLVLNKKITRTSLTIIQYVMHFNERTVLLKRIGTLCQSLRWQAAPTHRKAGASRLRDPSSLKPSVLSSGPHTTTVCCIMRPMYHVLFSIFCALCPKPFACFLGH